MAVITILLSAVALVGAFFFMGIGNRPNEIIITNIINNASDFINFANSMNNGISYSGTTVYLNSDINFSEESSKQFESIRKDSLNYFNGVFDGQGHVISNLKIDSASSFTGLFDYSGGTTIKNVVLDNSCSITSSNFDYIYSIGGIIGYCTSEKGACSIESSINMASITFVGDTKSSVLNIGGIVGFLSSSSQNHSITVKNCANYGSITYSGKNERPLIGGIVGASWDLSRYRYIQNCVNYGTITYKGKANKMYIGGIIGISYHTYVENCLSSGKISYAIAPSATHVGSIVGSIFSETYINYCFWTSDVGVDKINDGYVKLRITGTPTSPISASDAVKELNVQVSSNSSKNWNKWLSNPKSETIKFSINSNKCLSLSSQAILLPDLVGNNAFKFDGWYTGSEYSKLFIDDEIATDKELYGAYNKKVAVIFGANGGNALSNPVKVVTLGGAYGELPKPTRKGYTFDGWFTDNNENITSKTIVKIAYDHTLYAHWVGNNYDVTYDVNGGSETPAESVN